jgi:hypothetical protein
MMGPRTKPLDPLSAAATTLRGISRDVKANTARTHADARGSDRHPARLRSRPV